MPSVDFADSCLRHVEDADFLYDRERWPNADHLYGLGAECGLKYAMQQSGMGLGPDGKPEDRKHRVHVAELWPRFHSFMDEHDGARHAALLPTDSPFAGWSMHQRYSHRSTVAPADVQPHREAARKVQSVVEQIRAGSSR